jgi:hypothetical protein
MNDNPPATVNVPLDEVLWAINLIVDDRGEGIWEIMPTLFGLWNSHRERAKHLSESLHGDESPSGNQGTDET